VNDLKEPGGEARMLNRRTVLTGAIAIPAVAGLGRPAKAAKFSMKFASELVDTHPGILRTREAADAIRRDTQGEIDIRVFPNSQLGSAQEMLSQIRNGAVDFYPAAAAGLSALVPVASISSLGFAFTSYDQVWSSLDGKLGELIRGEIAKTNAIIAMDAMWDNGFRQITNSVRPITQPADLKGIKLRVPLAQMYTSMFAALGAAPTAISIAELYTSLQTKLVDGQENPLVIIDLFKFYEVQKYCSVTNHMWDGWWVLANRRSWDRMPPDVRKVVAEHLNKAALAMRGDVAKLNAGVTDSLIKTGLLINTLSDTSAFRRVLSEAGFYATWRKTYGADAWSTLELTSGSLT
jgi:TRAP-type transport system periplasmic protein